jgi:hypothetical protein
MQAGLLDSLSTSLFDFNKAIRNTTTTTTLATTTTSSTKQNPSSSSPLTLSSSQPTHPSITNSSTITTTKSPLTKRIRYNDSTTNNHQIITNNTTTTRSSKWDEFIPAERTPENLRDARMLALRRYADPKHYFVKDDFITKKSSAPKVFQLGTVISGIGERSLKKNERQQNISLEFLSDNVTRSHAKKVFKQVQEKATSGGKNDYKKRMNLKNGKYNKKKRVIG